MVEMENAKISNQIKSNIFATQKVECDRHYNNTANVSTGHEGSI